MKKLFSLFLLILSLNTYAGLTDPEEVEFTGALNDGDLKTVKMYVEQKAVPLEDKYFAWTPFLITAAKNQFEILKYLTENLSAQCLLQPFEIMIQYTCYFQQYHFLFQV